MSEKSANGVGGSDQRGPELRPRGVPPSALTDAAGLGLTALAEVLVRAEDGLLVADTDRRYVYANPSACQILGRSIEQLRGLDMLGSFPAGEHATLLEHLPPHLGEVAGPFTCVMRRPDGSEREMACHAFGIELSGGLHSVVTLRDLDGPRAAARTAAALAQMTAQLVGSTTVAEMMTGIARHAVEGTRAVYCSISLMNEQHQLAARGGFGVGHDSDAETGPFWISFSEGPVLDEVVAVMTGGSVVLGEPAGPPTVVADARTAWAASPMTRGLHDDLDHLGWESAVCLPLSWMDRVFGLCTVFLPRGVEAPSDAELAFYTALADQAAVAVANARLTSQARQGAALVERSRLARELHDSVSQGLFSMTMHARAAQLAMVREGQDENGPLGRSIAELAELTRGALAEMRALIFELRPTALAEEGLVAALRKQAAALNARVETVITVEGPPHRLDVDSAVEEHLYRIAAEALNNVVKHAGADRATVSVTQQTGGVHVAVSDDGGGFDPEREHPGHLGLSTMAERAEAIGAELVVSSTPGNGTVVTVLLSAARQDRREAAPHGV